MKQHYVVGFLFGEGNEVALITKNKPEWMKNKLNGIGGKVEPGELPFQAMVREFGEESGAYVTSWTYFCEMSGPDWVMHCFYARNQAAFDATYTATDEIIGTYDTPLDRGRLVPHVEWMVPMALQHEAISYSFYRVSVDASHLTGEVVPDAERALPCAA